MSARVPGAQPMAAPTACLVLATAVACLLFAPVFGIQPLLLPLGALAVVIGGTSIACSRRAALAAWRPVLVTVAGLLTIAETLLLPSTAGGVPTNATVQALLGGITDSWRLTLQSTWPARAEPSLLLFVPLLMVLACVLGIELLQRTARPLAALAPSFAVVVLSQLYFALPVGAATGAALAYVAAAGLVLAATSDTRGRCELGRPRLAPALASAVPPIVLATVGALLAGIALPTAPAMYALKREQATPLTEATVLSPLDRIAQRLSKPDEPVFEVHDGSAADRWGLVVLDEFDGINWRPGGSYRRMGAWIRPGSIVDVGTDTHSARIEVIDLEGPWLPSQTWPAAVRGARPLVAEQRGTLLAQQAGAGTGYEISWWEPRIQYEQLAGAAVDPDAPGGLGPVGSVPPGVADLAASAVAGSRPSFQAALVLERFFRTNYQLARGPNLPTGHSWPQLADFLLRTKRGTSEQFAASYVALARILGIPSRLVVGFRASPEGESAESYVVRNEDVLAWPEVAVEGVGWVRLDPTGATATAGGEMGKGLAAAAAQARKRLPDQEDLTDPPVAPAKNGAPVTESRAGGWLLPLAAVLGAVVVFVGLVWLCGIPAAVAVRARRRARRQGQGAVIGALEEVRDRLRAHGLAVSAGMTVRDMAVASSGFVDDATVAAIHSLGVTADQALWSGAGPGERSAGDAWRAVREVRRGLARRGWRARLRAASRPSGLLGGRG